MPFTSPDLVRAHIANASFGAAPVKDVPIILSGTSPVQLPHTGILDDSVTIKADRSNSPVKESRSLASGWVILNYPRLIPGSVAVAKDDSLGAIYTENVDFIVDYTGGRVRRIESGAIASGQTVSIWYDHYHVYAEGDDYTVNALIGQLTRKPTGLIADGQPVLVDYTVSLGSVSDTVIEQAIAESGEAVLALVSDTHQQEPSPGLVIGATHLAVAQLARMRAAATLADSSLNATLSRAAAQLWLEIAGQYDLSARAFLSRFANPIASRTPLRRG